MNELELRTLLMDTLAKYAKDKEKLANPTDEMDIKELSRFSAWHSFQDFVTYSTVDIKTQEALESFRELYQIVSDKLFGIEDAFDEIIQE